LIRECEQRAARLPDLFVRDRTGSERQVSRPTEDFYRERLLVAGREGLESVEEFDRLVAHMFTLAVFLTGSNGAGLWRDGTAPKPGAFSRYRTFG
jgi:hypothetical protein